MKKYLLIVLFLFSTHFYAQNETTNRFVVTSKVNKLLGERSDCAAQYKTSFKYYHIQLYNGQNISRARYYKSEFLADFPQVFAVIEWESPEYKVWVGEYETKLSADQALLKIRKKFPNAFIVNPK